PRPRKTAGRTPRPTASQRMRSRPTAWPSTRSWASRRAVSTPASPTRGSWSTRPTPPMEAERVRIRRVLTSTPLARLHERTILQRGPRKGVVIPWDSFRRDDHPRAALALAYDAQRMLALGEYAAVGLFSRFVEALARIGAPFDIVSAATRVPQDEIRHADLAFRFASMCAARDVAVDSPDERPSRWKDRLSVEDLDSFAIEVIAIGETLACALLSACRDGATEPLARAIYTNIVADEVHHARLGWYYLLWRAPQWSAADRQRVADDAGAMV